MTSNAVTRWGHVPIVELIKATGIPLKQQGHDPDGNAAYVGGHTTQHSSESGASLVVWPGRGFWLCRKCNSKGNAGDWLLDAGKIGDVFIESRKDAVAYLTETYGPSPEDWQEPEPFTRAHGPEFPSTSLPMGMRPYVEEVAEAYQVPVDLPANLALASSSAGSREREGRPRLA